MQRRFVRFQSQKLRSLNFFKHHLVLIRLQNLGCNLKSTKPDSLQTQMNVSGDIKLSEHENIMALTAAPEMRYSRGKERCQIIDLTRQHTIFATFTFSFLMTDAMRVEAKRRDREKHGS